jgi:L-threonylcarbamoyladenylate synthase
MQTRRLPASEPDSLKQALSLLNTGGLVAFPTDTVYGLGALAFDGAAIQAIYAAKDRPIEKAIPVLLADTHELEKVAQKIPQMARVLAEHFWPGPLTLVVPKQATLPQAISATSTIAVRVPDHPVALDLLKLTGPMAVTSANLSGEPSPTSAEEVYGQLGQRIAIILDGGVTPGGVPSTVVDCTGVEPLILREGPVRWEELIQALEDHPSA